MAKRTRRKTTKRGATIQTIGRRIAAWFLQRQVLGVVFATLGAITFVSLISGDQGMVSSAWTRFLRQVFGVGAYPLSVLALCGGLLLIFYQALGETVEVRWKLVVGAELFFFAGLGFLHVISEANPLSLAERGLRGGYVGWMFWRATVPFVGRPVAALLLALVALAGLYMASGLPWRTISWRVLWVWGKLGVAGRNMIAARRSNRIRKQTEADRAQQLETASSAPGTLRRAQPARRQPRRRQHASTQQGSDLSGDLPPIELLISDASKGIDEAGARHRAQVIEETFAAFGIPAEVVEWNRGPAVTQFGVEPGYIEKNDRQYKVRVSKMLSLQNDLALALAAAPIRIEAPVPGRAIVGIEVPNEKKTIVGLRDILESEAFANVQSPLKLGIGRDVSGSPIVTDLVKMPHLLIAGATGSGKSVCLNAIIVSLLYQHTADTLQLLLIDPKRVELTKYNGVPHLIAPVVVEVKKVVVALRWLTQEMETRYKAFSEIGVRNLEEYNRAARKRHHDKMPLIVVVVDELADLMLAAPDDVERTICRLAQMARATGIHLIIATQRPSVDVVTGLIKANFPARISFAVSSQVDSRVILDTPGAEKLLGQGDMLFMVPDSPKLQRVQGSFVSDREIDALMGWYEQHVAVEPEEPEEDDNAPPWEGMSVEEDPDSELLDQAEDLVRERNHASASFLQRHMRIGYPRAARLIDQLEEKGVVGPKRRGGRSRIVLAEGDDEQDAEPVEADA